ncbi:MAG: TIGR00374 family protein [Bacteroidetes bacterium]|nr:TIGR00374 family protein [Bacteroidota bacterium]
MSSVANKILDFFSFRRIAIPIVIGLAAASYLVYKNFDLSVFKNINWSWTIAFWLFMAVLLMGVRAIAYMYRLRILTDNQISWRRSFDTIMLWEFASSITPSIVGGSAIALYIVNKEGINMGRTTAIVLITSLFDEIFYITVVPIVIFLAGYDRIFTIDAEFALLSSKVGLLGVFLSGYIFIVILSFIIFYGIFINPRGTKWILIKLFKLPFLKKWFQGAVNTGDQIITTSKEMKGKGAMFWFKVYFSTFITWTARFWMVNCIILAFIAVNEHFLIYARQLVMWVILLISPTPGGSGVAEFIFSDFLGEFITPGLVPALAFLWRLLSFYPYIFIGVIILPAWIRRVYNRS